MSAIRAAVTFADGSKVAPYEIALREAGIEPIGNPVSLDSLDGLLLTGGTDVNPALYGQKPAVEGEEPDNERDQREIRLLREALAAELPVFAICRGMQLFNVALGGTLVQHLGSTDVHRQQPQNAEAGKHPAVHRVWVAPNTRLAEIIGGGGHDVNSRHHQAVESVGKGLIVSAISSDGVIEAIEKPGAAFAVAVQWHPEDRIFVSAADHTLFDAFAAAMAKKASVAK
ncbi:MAG: gamma-glutamyl-gamma-aminobutyrate hydrolase family protein [Bryobacterales bacterium]|nr:gamma-glutamyl-gamma-aminobutyrate hydrolase family protein [Bryobacterales bacterium]